MNIDRIKQLPFVRWVYGMPFLMHAYHFSLVFLAAAWFAFPSGKLKVVGVTGTKGKSTTLELLATLLESAGHNVALLSSVRMKIDDFSEQNMTGNTMPGRFAIQKFLSRAARAKCDFALLEVTSQGVLLSRHRFIRFSDAVITNIAPEHIEAHGSFEAYRDAKLSFLAHAALKGARVFINDDDGPSRYFGEHLPRDVRITGYSKRDLPPLSPAMREILPGEFNRENLAAAMAVAKAYGISEESLMRGLAEFRGVPGRMEFVVREPFPVVVDSAHTPDSLRACYAALKPRPPGRLICVLGSAGGGRDKWKRSVMGKVAAEYCDRIILANEDPYDESPEEITEAIAEGIRARGHREYTTIFDREGAIVDAIACSRRGDVVVVTGKGSEPYMHFDKGRKISWSDREAAKRALRTTIK